MEVLIDFIITVTAYMLFPFIYFHFMQHKHSKKTVILINFINSMVIMILFILLREIVYGNNAYRSGASMLYWVINNAIYTKYAKENSESKKTKNKTKKNKNLALILTLFILIISLTFNIVLISKHSKLKDIVKSNEKEIQSISKELKTTSNSLFNILDGNSAYYIQNKLNFFDSNIVFVIDGYGNYYSDYDCMIARVGNNRYNYWAYNKEAAVSKGYKEYICESEIETYSDYCKRTGECD